MKNAKKKNRSSRLTIVLLAVALVLVAVLAVMIVLISSRPESPEVIDPTAAPQLELPEQTEAPADVQEPSEAPVATQNADEPGAVTEPAPEATEAPTEAKKPEEQSEAPTEAPKPTEGKKPAEPSKETTPPAQKQEPVTTVETPYGKLNFPKEWGGFLRTEIKKGTPYTVTYFADLESGKSQKLFSISFGGDAAGAVGMLKVDGSEVSVQVESVVFQPDSGWSDKEVNIVFSMQEALNDILADLKLIAPQQKPQEPESILPEDNGTDMAIDTPYGELYYPSRWKDHLSVKTQEKNGYSVSFYGEVSGHASQCLFVVHFGNDKGIEVGTVKDPSGRDVRVSVEIVPFEPDNSWADADTTLIYAMQEDMNYLLTKLG